MTSRGFVTPQPHKCPKSSFVRFAAEQPNERWQLDITHWQLADGTGVEILNVPDDHSRLCLDSTAGRVFKARDAENCFRTAATSYGDPASMLSDNGAVFTGRSRGGGRFALEITLNTRGIGFGHSRPYHPQTCGKVDPAACSPSATTAGCTTSASGAGPPGTDVLVLFHDLHIRVLNTDGEPLRELLLDPSKDYQPQPKP